MWHLGNASRCSISRWFQKNLKKQGLGAEGTAKSEWAKKISPHMNVFCNKSPSFNYFKDTLDRLKG